MPRPPWAYNGLLVALVAVFCALTFLVGLGRYGLWEELEVQRVEHAIAGAEAPVEGEDAIAPGPPGARDALAGWLIVAAHEAGRDEVSLRLPAAAVALVTLLVGLLIGAALFGVRPAVYGTVVLAGMPIFMITGRLLVWSPFPILAHTLIVGGVALTCFGRWRPPVNVAVGLVLALAGSVIGALSAGSLVGTTAPLLGAVFGLAAGRPWRSGRLSWIPLVACGVAAVALVVVVIVSGDAWIERTATDPTFESHLKRMLLGSFPWTGLIVVGLGVLAHPQGADERRGAAGGVLLSGLSMAFVVQTLWGHASGGAPLAALWPLAMGAGLVLDRAEGDERPRRVAATIVALLMILGLRDHLLTPDVALVSLGVADAQLPEGASGRSWFVLVTVALGVPLVLARVRGGRKKTASGREWFSKAFGWLLPRPGRGHALRWVALGVPVVLFVHGVLAVLVPDALWFPYLSCLERRIWLAAGLLLPAVVAAAVVLKASWELTGRLGRWKVPLAVGTGAAVTLVLAHLVIPAMSRQLSNRELVRTYERLSSGGERLLSYRAETSSSHLVGGPESSEASNLEELVRDLVGDREERASGKTFAVVRREDLSRIDARFRARTSRHVPVADDSSSAALLLVSSLPEKLDRNPLRSIVPSERPRPKQAVRARFDDKIELLGTDVVGRDGSDRICPADAFKIRFYWHCLKTVVGQKKIFVHVDGYGLRINGDHDPADGAYPVTDWQVGDYVVDELQLRVPLHFRPGDYPIYVGFFQGSKRMDVTDGPSTSDDRVKAGVVRVR
jgi:hypothetical protein